MIQMTSLSLFLPLSLFLFPPLPPSPSLCPSVMALVHPHVYLYYKAEESGRLKMKTPTRECLCAHFVNVYVHGYVCVNMHSFILFGSKHLFYIQGWNSSALHRPLHSCFPSLPIPLLSSSSRHGQVAAFFSLCLTRQVSSIDRKRHSNLKQ